MHLLEVIIPQNFLNCDIFYVYYSTILQISAINDKMLNFCDIRSISYDIFLQQRARIIFLHHNIWYCLILQFF